MAQLWVSQPVFLRITATSVDGSRVGERVRPDVAFRTLNDKVTISDQVNTLVAWKKKLCILRYRALETEGCSYCLCKFADASSNSLGSAAPYFADWQ